MSTEIEVKDDKPWLFKKGQLPPNNQGRSKWVKSVRDLARGFTAEGLELLKMCARDDGASWGSRIQAINTLLDRAWGKPEQSISVERVDDREIAGLTTLELKRRFLQSLGNEVSEEAEIIEGTITEEKEE